jgi:hypothetical protein
MHTISLANRKNVMMACNVSGTGALNTTLAAAAAVNSGGGLVRLPVTADLFSAGSYVLIEGSVAYNGLMYIAAAAAGYIYVRAVYTAETFAGTETVKVGVAPGVAMELCAFSIALASAPVASEDFTITIDSILGAAYDYELATVDFSVGSLTQYSYVYPVTERLPLLAGDILRVAWTNTNTKTYGLILYYQYF